jgi:copper transport protein
MRPLREEPPAAPVREPVLVGGPPSPPPTAVAPAALAAPKLAALAVPLAALTLLPSLGGHASVQDPVEILLLANIVHVLAISAWLGGVAVLVFALRSATSSLPAAERTPLLATVVGNFSALAGPALALVLLTGAIQGIIEVGAFGALLDSAFGRAVLIKVVVALGIVALGAVNRQRLLPALRAATGSPGQTGVLLRRTLRAELALGLVALAATGALSGYAPSTSESSGPYSSDQIVGPARVEITVDPARIGPNELHLYLFNRTSGAPYTAAKDLTITAALPSKHIAKLALSPHVAGPGHYVVNGASFGVAGKWTITATIRVSDFDEFSKAFAVPIES